MEDSQKKVTSHVVDDLESSVKRRLPPTPGQTPIRGLARAESLGSKTGPPRGGGVIRVAPIRVVAQSEIRGKVLQRPFDLNKPIGVRSAPIEDTIEPIVLPEPTSLDDLSLDNLDEDKEWEIDDPPEYTEDLIHNQQPVEEVTINEPVVKPVERPVERSVETNVGPTWMDIVKTFQSEFAVRNLIQADQNAKLRAASLLMNIFKGAEKDKELQKKLKALPSETLVNLMGSLATCISDLS